MMNLSGSDVQILQMYSQGVRPLRVLSPFPRFDLLKLNQYLQVGIQLSRGCPFSCEFCDIIELYGRVPRTKTNEQVLAELDALYALGYRGQQLNSKPRHHNLYRCT